MDSKTHIEKAVGNVRSIFEKAAARIDALAPGEKVPATTLAADLAKELGMTGPQLYPTLKILFDGYPGVDIKRGAHGGIMKLPLPTAATTNTAPTVAADSAADAADSAE